MPRFEYKVVPAPQKGLKAKGIKGAEARFSHALEELMNGLAGDGWEYQRAETLPSIERAGLTSTTTEWRNVLVFRRLRENDTAAFAPELLPPPPTEMEVDAAETAPHISETSDTPKASPVVASPTVGPAPTAAADAAPAWDNGVEDTADVAGVGSTLETLAAARKSAKTDG
ncbi:DUF4177 domain-containing protein [Sulfitobacter sp. M57]|uniref:DUF4177 domain-containing protein n=1 Tax=unclassified Sulfitobacter TaxID=196795 RepID=UPI0023E0FC45|nr:MULTISPECIES: DUF4177 domain-containing protein [unclassified Sulfitobacter]MDF3414101.1 DUF4177 domain-containing protein [Sulfitobacter sp. KE5]MDF3420618.1 DUF4177 domain-containing protein [Sulfitobacter sp. KE43]MDF3432647.1 DUF4177 domain-containing protein [Sulfitobacter sp. KE42]MDF3458286.1 DUF4177 domain-containing protein [Sulfitobacter sp. S74]MDF3462187.1 DUF4177 domain-containing protein [Sulfitobacter sp. Ks18]